MNVNMLGFLSVGGWQVFLIIVVILIMFGGKKMPELARGLGQSIKEFKKATREATDEINRAVEEEHHAPPPRASKPADTVSQTPAPPKA
jgi:sec-independent protein translocase protein TatA